MPKFYVKTMVEFSAEIEADSVEHAEQLGWDYDNLMYDGVYSIDVEELEEDEEDE